MEGIAAEITEPGGWLWSLIRAADGTASPDTIVRRVRRVHPKAPAAEVLAALNALIDGGYAEEAAAAVPPDLSAAEQERYDRGMRWFRWADLTPRASRWDVQRRLKAARVTLIGLGGTGGAAALALAGSGVGALHCVDADEVSLSNLNRHVLYTTADVGRPKAEAALDRLRLVNPDITITAEERLIASAADLARASAGSSLLVLCADEPTGAAAWANRGLAARRPWVDNGSRPAAAEPPCRATGRAGSACGRPSGPGWAAGNGPGRARRRAHRCPGTRPPRSPRACPGSSPRTWRWPC